MKVILLVLFLLNHIYLFAQTPDSVYHSFVQNGYVKGQQISWKEKNNTHIFLYKINDRGRGIDVKETVVTNNNGFITSVETKGVDYFKTPYHSSFRIEGDSVVHILNKERKSAKFSSQVYIATTAPGVKELVMRWLVKQPGKIAPEFPGDSVRLSEPTIHKFNFAGKPLLLKLYSRPNGFTWIIDDLKFFASVNRLGGIILKGYESLVDTLFVLQETSNKDFFLKQHQTLSKALKKIIVIKNAVLFHSTSATVSKNMTLKIVNGEIVSITPSNNQPILADTVIDAKQKFLMPGLWDTHTHYNWNAGSWYIAGGVTHVRDMATMPFQLEMKKQIASNELLGPDISYTSGLIDKEDSLQAPTGKIVPTLEEAIKAVNYYHKYSYDQIKLYSSLKPEWVQPIASHAHKLGMKIAGHVPAYMSAERAIKSGYKEITHMNMLFMNFMRPDTLASNGIARIKVPGLYAGTINLNSKKVTKFIRLMKRKDVVHEPTLRIQEDMFTEFKGDTSKADKPILSWLSEYSKNNLAKETSVAADHEKEAYRASFKNYLTFLKLLFDKGITLLAGTDGGYAVSLHRELEIFNEAGIPSNEVLKIATYNPSKVFGLLKEFGEIKVGRKADFILIDGDPIKNISDIRKVELVIKNGRIYSPKQIYSSRGWGYYY